MYTNSLIVLALSALASAQDSCSMHPMGANGWASALSAALPAMKTSNPQLANAAQDFLQHASASSWEAPATLTKTDMNTMTAQLAAPTSSVADAVEASATMSSSMANAVQASALMMNNTATVLSTATNYATETNTATISEECSSSSVAAAVATGNSVAAPMMAANGSTANAVPAMTSAAMISTASAMPSFYPIHSANATATHTMAVNPVASNKPVPAKSSGLPVQNSGAEKLAGSALFGVVALAAFVL